MTGALVRWRSSAAFVRSFCPVCGSRVVSEDPHGAEVELSLGSFDHAGRIAPEYESWIVQREPWLATLPVPQHRHERVG